MNWIGGSRKRTIYKQERRKQKEFFEKNKLRSKLMFLESASPKMPNISLDLLNLQIVNQISNRKDMEGKSMHTGNNGDTRKVTGKLGFVNLNLTGGRNKAVLPMSPITSPSSLCLDDCDIASLQAKDLEDNIHPLSMYLPNQARQNLQHQARDALNPALLTSREDPKGPTGCKDDAAAPKTPELRIEENKDIFHSKYRKEVVKMQYGSELNLEAEEYLCRDMFSKEMQTNELLLPTEGDAFPQMNVLCQSKSLGHNFENCDRAPVAREFEFTSHLSDSFIEAARNISANVDATRRQGRPYLEVYKNY